MIKYRTIVHIDMDAFFASIEQLDNPEYRNKPVIVGADPMSGKGRGVVSASSYEARKYGVYSALPISQAYRKCPHGIFVRPRMKRYSEMSDTIMDIFEKFSPLVEAISIDEAFLDCTGTENLFGTPVELGKRIKATILDQTGLTASIGISSNKSISKIASDLKKPDGLTICPFGHEKEFLSPLPVEKLWGAGKKTVRLLNNMGFKNVGDIAGFPLKDIERLMGKWGTHLWYLANGIDDRPVSYGESRKSISEERTFNTDINDDNIINETILNISDSLARSMRNEDIKGRTITLKIRLEGFETHTRDITLNKTFCDMFTIRDNAMKLYSSFDRLGKKIRLIGIKISKLTDIEDEDVQMELFNDNADFHKIETLEKILNDMKDNFGKNISRASLLKK